MGGEEVRKAGGGLGQWNTRERGSRALGYERGSRALMMGFGVYNEIVANNQ